MRLVTLATLLALGLPSIVQAEDVKPSWTIPDGHKWTAVNGYPLTYRDEGSGTPVVLVHGATNDSRAWGSNIDVLAKTHRVIAVHLRHFYPEKWNGQGTDYSIEQHAADVATLIKQLNLGKVHLVGHSRGGAVVIEVAKKAPEVIRTLILPDGSMNIATDPVAPKNPSTQTGPSLIGTLQANLRANEPLKGAEQFIDALNGPGGWANTPSAIQTMILDNIWTALGEKPFPVTACDEVKKFDFPVLLLTGEKSPKRFEAAYDVMRKCNDKLPSTVVVPNAAHGMQRMNSEFFNKTVLEFAATH